MLKVLIQPFQKFLNLQSSGSILLLLATVGALAWSNFPWSNSYDAFWHSTFSWTLGSLQLRFPLQFWINEGLMTLFFLLVGLEIKREFLTGELATPQQARLPILGALGGMIVPAGIYLLLNPPGSTFANGWAIPTVTDIAFAVGALSSLGNRVPLGLKVFLIALAIVDDIGAILIIALFYSQGIQPFFLLAAAGILLMGLLLNRKGVNQPWPYLLLGLPLWLALLKSGIHPTIAGVLLAVTVPASVIISPKNPQNETQSLETNTNEELAPLPRLENALHPWVTYAVLPLFALANAGVHLPMGQISSALGHPLALSIITGLFLGKPLGITLAAWIAVQAGWAKLPANVSLRQLHAAGVLGGIGFTMSVFITLLAFQEPAQVSIAKRGILFASGLSAIVGIGLLWLSTDGKPPTAPTLPIEEQP